MNELRSDSDRQLLEHIRLGSTAAEPAFRVLYDRHIRRLLAYCTKVMGGQQQARDIVQDAFMKLLLAIRKGEQLDNVGAYLMRIARNGCLNMKRDHRETLMEIEDLGLTSHDVPYETIEIQRLVNAALQELPEQYREALLLQMYGGLSYAEICEVTGDSLPSVRHHIARAKQRLRAALIPILRP